MHTIFYAKSYVAYNIKLKNILVYNTNSTAIKCLIINKAGLNAIINIQNVTSNLLGIFFWYNKYLMSIFSFSIIKKYVFLWLEFYTFMI